MAMSERTDLTFCSATLRLEGTLTVPTTSPGPAALLISGSGPLDRNSNSAQLAINVMRELAAHLAASGVASLRYDKRGVGNSDGNYLCAGLHDNITDARAALDALRERPEVDPARVFVVGHSEGAIIASELAGDARLAGVVLLAGTAQNGRDLLTWQAKQIASTVPAPVRWLTTLLGRDVERTQSRRLAQMEASSEDVVRTRATELNAKWFREFMAHEPSEALRGAQAPILAITGGKDLQVDPADVSLMDRLVGSPFTGHVVDDLSHLLRIETGAATLRTYANQARQPVDADVARLVTDWVSSVCGGVGGLLPDPPPQARERRC